MQRIHSRFLVLSHKSVSNHDEEMRVGVAVDRFRKDYQSGYYPQGTAAIEPLQQFLAVLFVDAVDEVVDQLIKLLLILAIALNLGGFVLSHYSHHKL